MGGVCEKEIYGSLIGWRDQPWGRVGCGVSIRVRYPYVGLTL